MMVRHFKALLLAASISVLGIAQGVFACPHCPAGKTFGEEFNERDVVVIVSLEKPGKLVSTSDEEGPEYSKAKFHIEKVIKGDSLMRGIRDVETSFIGEAKVGQRFLIMGVGPSKMIWLAPLKLSDRSEQYLGNLLGLPEKGPERLAFFQKYLEDDDAMLAGDAYDEFAKAPYAEIKGLKADMDHDRLIDWIKDTNLPANHRRLYLVMLGICGSDKDLAMLEQLMKSTDRKKKAGLDAMISCYLTLKGPDGMTLVEDLFLKNKDAEYSETYAAIMSLRFHGKEDDVISRERVLQGLRCILERPQLADLVIPDLAKWEDWSVMDKLVKLFKESDAKSSWVRVPVVNYLRACPLPASDGLIEQLRKIDAAAVKRAETFFPIGSSTVVGD